MSSLPSHGVRRTRRCRGKGEYNGKGAAMISSVPPRQRRSRWSRGKGEGTSEGNGDNGVGKDTRTSSRRIFRERHTTDF